MRAIILGARGQQAVSEAPITVETIAAAERIAGVVYTDAERELMLDNLAAQIDLAHLRRATSLPVDLAPATRFDPRPLGWTAADPGPFRPVEQAASPVPTSEEDIAFAPAARLSAWIRAGALTSTRLTEIYLERIERLNPALKCF